MKHVKKFHGKNPDVWKYVFDFNGSPAEAVLYKYGSFQERTVICCSVQSGCPIGCTFCGTGKKFRRDLKAWEILEQVEYILLDNDIDQTTARQCNKLQIMFMSIRTALG